VVFLDADMMDGAGGPVPVQFADFFFAETGLNDMPGLTFALVLGVMDKFVVTELAGLEVVVGTHQTPAE
jgi:hypothetical protein